MYACHWNINNVVNMIQYACMYESELYRALQVTCQRLGWLSCYVECHHTVKKSVFINTQCATLKV